MYPDSSLNSLEQALRAICEVTSQAYVLNFHMSNKIQFSTFTLYIFLVDGTLVEALSLGGFFSLSLTFQSTGSRRPGPF